MKNDELSTSDVINQTWALKGKRKRIPSRKVRSNGNIIGSVPSGSHTTTKPKEQESSSERAPTKEKDGEKSNYSYVLLSCNYSWVKRIPNGKWKCPSCCLKNNLAERVHDADLTSKRAKLKITIKKSKSKINPTKDDKNGKKRSSKWKSAFSITDGDVSGSSSSDDKKEKQTDEEANVNHSHEKKVILGVGSSKKKSTKRKCEDPPDDGQKKQRTNKGKKSADGSQKSEAKAHLDSSSSPVKRKSVRHLKIKSLSKDDKGRELRDKKLKDEVFEEATNSSPESGKAGNVEIQNFADLSQFQQLNLNNAKANMPLPCAHILQVDRVLGCRIQVSEIDSGHHHSATEAHSMSSQSPSVADKYIGQLEETSKCNGSDVADAETISEGTGNILTSSDTQRLTSDCGEENITDLAGRSMDEDTKHKDDSALNFNNLAKPAEEIPRGDNTNCVSNFHEVVDDQIVVEANLSHKKKDSSVAKSLPRDGKMVSYEYLVKWVGKSHLHNSWVSESQLKVMAKRKYDNYNYKYGKTLINISEERWKLPQRVIAKYGSEEVFVKWTGLPYEECTWEMITEPFITKSSHLIDLFDQFERRTLEKDAADYETVKEKSQFHYSDVVTLTEQPKELGGSLFPHQLEALNWLRKCWSKSKNVILADEMGLGKTISACAFLSSLCFEFKARLPCLVLVPLSTMPNWMAEFSLWAPNINVVEYHGCAKARALMREYEWHANDPVTSKKTSSYKFNVLLTTYEMVLADSNHLSKVPWEVLIVDEGHRLKNSGSKLFSLLNTFSFQHRVLLTGTPLQNNLGEMYNLLNFLQPSSFPSLKSFEDKFRDLTTAEKVDELKKLVAPHMLRRLKKDAMQNIPPKTERVVPVDLSTIQAEYYRAMLTKNYQLLRNIGKGVPQQSMLNIVMQLRKVCNHPYLIQGTEPESGTVEFLHDMRIKASAKLALLHTMLKILHKEGHRVLIFSQMTKLLDILEDYLNIEFGPKTFERVDGSVSIADRQMAIARFNQDKSRFVFLLSTRACGLGINLASADTVIIYDSDFNPHADIQAMNRAHRIGQSKRLLVYRLVVRASVEERILQLAKKKLMLDHLFVNKTGSQKEVEDILKWGTEQLFNDSSKDSGEQNENKREGSVDSEHKNKRRVGGLGDVYQDKCTEGSTQIVWDEAAILKLLDRSIIDSVSTDNAEGDMENDMLGSVKSLDWNEEPVDEQGGTELSSAIIDGTTIQNFEKEEDISENVTDENEWDRLLRVRNLKQMGMLVPCPIGECAKAEPEPEPEREYTPAGKALKTKFAKLRARQKDRLARMKTLRETPSSEGQNGMGPLWPPTSDGQNKDDQEDKPSQTSVPITSKTDPNINTTKILCKGDKMSRCSPTITCYAQALYVAPLIPIGQRPVGERSGSKVAGCFCSGGYVRQMLEADGIRFIEILPRSFIGYGKHKLCHDLSLSNRSYFWGSSMRRR
ncbi:chromatin remodeling 4-like protein isoform X1 [Tanacetum coccineum]